MENQNIINPITDQNNLQLNQAPIITTNKEKKLKILLLIFISLFLIALFFSFYYLNNLKKTKSQSLSKINNEISPIISKAPTIIDKDANQILILLRQTLNTNSPITKNLYNTEWYQENNQRVPLETQGFGIGTFENKFIGKYGNYNDINSITEESLRPLQAIIDNFFISNGFQKNNQNTFKKYNYLISGYSQGNLKCVITLETQTDPFGSFNCGFADKNQMAWRKELESIFPNDPTNDTITNITKLIDNYATGGSGGYGGGARWWAVKVDEKWKIVWETQDSMACQIVEKYKIPKEMYDDCYSGYSQEDLDKYLNL